MRGLFSIVFFAACGSSSSSALAPQRQLDPPPAAPSCESFGEWRSERIELPPEFAPTMPVGVEELRFAPGMFEPRADDYFAYVFSLDFEERAPADVAGITSLLAAYYGGLMSAVAEAKGIAMTSEATSVSVAASAGGFTATVQTIDAFTDGKPLTITVELRLGKGGTCVSAMASAKPLGAAIWATLEAARSCVPCP